jgi:hypothetical protein
MAEDFSEFEAWHYWFVVWEDWLEREPPGTKLDDLIAREKQHAEALRKARGTKRPNYYLA